MFTKVLRYVKKGSISKNIDGDFISMSSQGSGISSGKHEEEV